MDKLLYRLLKTLHYLVDLSKSNFATVLILSCRYGDRIPRTPFGRLVCLTWIVLGVIMVTCFNSTMTTLLTARILDKEVNLYGTKVCLN